MNEAKVGKSFGQLAACEYKYPFAPQDQTSQQQLDYSNSSKVLSRLLQAHPNANLLVQCFGPLATGVIAVRASVLHNQMSFLVLIFDILRPFCVAQLLT